MQYRRCFARLLVSLAPLAMLIPSSCTTTGPAGPEQPASGPGSPGSVASDVRTTDLGSAGPRIFLYEPQGAGLTSAPVIVFLHGYSGVNPYVYGAWIKHLVLRGAIVLYPVYQDDPQHPEQYTADALAAVRNAYDTLRAGGHILPDDTKLALVGHSLGGTIAMNLAAVAHTNGLPRVLALMEANGGDSKTVVPSVATIQASNYDLIPAEMLFLGVVGQDDDMVGAEIVVSFYNALMQIPSANREVVQLNSDAHGSPALRADHFAPLAVDRAFDTGVPSALGLGGFGWLLGLNLPTDADSINALDYYGYWKWLDALTDAAFYGTDREFALGNTPEQTFMGTWADGQPVVPAVRILPSTDHVL